MQNGIWVIVLATEESHGAGYLATTPALLREQLDFATALAPRPRVYAVVTQAQRRRLESYLWYLLRSNVLTQPDEIGTGHGILMTLLQISEQDPDACIVLLPSTHHEFREGSFLDSLRNAAAYAAKEPEHVVGLNVEPDGPDAGIVVGHARALLNLFEPEIVDVLREIVGRAPDARAEPIAATDFLERLSLPYLDFHRDVLTGETHHFGQQILPVRATAPI